MKIASTIWLLFAIISIFLLIFSIVQINTNAIPKKKIKIAFGAIILIQTISFLTLFFLEINEMADHVSSWAFFTEIGHSIPLILCISVQKTGRKAER